MHSLNNIFLLVNDGSHQFCGIDVTAAHFKKMGVSIGKNRIYNFFCIVDLTNCGNGIGAVVGTHDQWLGLVI